MWKLDPRSSEPIYLQLAGQVRQLAAAGQLRAGQRLPTVRELAAGLRVNFNTVARAYRLLHEQGVISTQQGRGTYLLEQPLPADQRRQRRRRLHELTAGFLAEARRLGYADADIAASLQAGLDAPG